MRARLLLLSLVLLACKKERATPPQPEPAALGPTRGSLAEYCGKAPCRSYDEAVAQVRKLAAPGGGPGCVRGNFGKCKDVRSVEFSDGFSGFQEWFDDKGTMVAAQSWADFRPQGASFGDVPTCTLEITEKLCR